MKKSWNILSQKNIRYKDENIINYLLRLRKVQDIKRFLNPSFCDLIPFYEMRNIELACEIVIDGIKNQKRFCIYYDCDLDGVSAGTIMYKYLQNHGVNNIKYEINKGKIHGMFHRTPEEFKDIDIMIIVDSLESDYKVYDALKSMGIQVVILEHHEFTEYPESAVLVSSALNYANKHLSGSGVTWKFCSYLDVKLETKYSKALLDLAACGIIADVCDVSENSYENRYIVSCGLNNLQNLALKNIIANYKFNSQSIIWSIAPLINAANRTGNNELTVKLFLSEDDIEIKGYLKQLKRIKEGQNDSILKTTEELELQIAKYNDLENDKVLIGIVPQGDYTGLIATKISNKYQKPTIILHEPSEQDGTGRGEGIKGSIRAYGIDNFKSLINSTKLAACFGHESAAGINCNKNSLSDLKEVLNSKLKNVEFVLKQNIDLMLEIHEISPSLILALNKINKICGNKFKPISVCIKDVEIGELKVMQDKHTKFSFGDMDFIKWNDIKIAEEILIEKEESDFVTIDIVGELSMNEFAGKKRRQLIISDYDNITSLPAFLK